MHKILVVEDSADSFNLVKRAIDDFAILDWAKSLTEALKILKKRSFDLILLDVTLPDGDGFRLCSLLQTDEKLREIPVIFLTALNSISDKVMGLSMGADDFISKPFDPQEFKARLDSRLKKNEHSILSHH
jgi:DNA-binding response OmpR family regulator